MEDSLEKSSWRQEAIAMAMRAWTGEILVSRRLLSCTSALVTSKISDSLHHAFLSHGAVSAHAGPSSRLPLGCWTPGLSLAHPSSSTTTFCDQPSLASQGQLGTSSSVSPVYQYPHLCAHCSRNPLRVRPPFPFLCPFCSALCFLTYKWAPKHIKGKTIMENR